MMHPVFFDPNELGLAKLDLGTSGLTAILGYAVVFFGLFLLLCLLLVSGSIFKALAKRKTAAAAVVPAPVAAPAVEAPSAPGSAGEVKRFDVPDKEAAMLMAIVAEQLQKPLNELRFISIKEVPSDEI